MKAVRSSQATGVWISASSATILRWDPEGVSVRERIDSTIPGRHRSTGRPPTEDHPAGEGHRDEQIRAFFARIGGIVPTDDDLLLVGDLEVVEQLADEITSQDHAHGTSRRLMVEKGGPKTEPQLLSRIRAFACSSARRSLPG